MSGYQNNIKDEMSRILNSNISDFYKSINPQLIEPFVKDLIIMIDSKYNKENYIILWVENGESIRLQNITQLKNLVQKFLGITDTYLFLHLLKEHGFYSSNGKFFSNPYFKKNKPELLKNIRRIRYISQKESCDNIKKKNNYENQHHLIQQIQFLEIENYNIKKQKYNLQNLLQEQIVQFSRIINNINYYQSEAYKQLQYLQNCSNVNFNIELETEKNINLMYQGMIPDPNFKSTEATNVEKIENNQIGNQFFNPFPKCSITEADMSNNYSPIQQFYYYPKQSLRQNVGDTVGVASFYQRQERQHIQRKKTQEDQENKNMDYKIRRCRSSNSI